MLRGALLCLSSFVIAGLFYFATSSGHSASWSKGYFSGALLASLTIGITLNKLFPNK